MRGMKVRRASGVGREVEVEVEWMFEIKNLKHPNLQPQHPPAPHAARTSARSTSGDCVSMAVGTRKMVNYA